MLISVVLLRNCCMKFSLPLLLFGRRRSIFRTPSLYSCDLSPQLPSACFLHCAGTTCVFAIQMHACRHMPSNSAISVQIFAVTMPLTRIYFRTTLMVSIASSSDSFYSMTLDTWQVLLLLCGWATTSYAQLTMSGLVGTQTWGTGSTVGRLTSVSPFD